MRFLLQVTFPHEKFNAAVRDGSITGKMQRIMAELKPESAYFVEVEGKRTGFMVVDMKETSQIPALAEPWFLTFGADVQIRPAMLPEDLAKAGLEGIGKKWA